MRYLWQVIWDVFIKLIFLKIYYIKSDLGQTSLLGRHRCYHTATIKRMKKGLVFYHKLYNKVFGWLIIGTQIV